ncbi:MAG TPA: nuclear transport factor 2 family protein [Steroidobacteraceae bacterium]|nr:nuclear transport factor 2 family protein [Steroidobacteraceae bacterium]
MQTRFLAVVLAVVVTGSVAAAEPKSAQQPHNVLMEAGSAPRHFPQPAEHRPSFIDADVRQVADGIGQVTAHEIVLAPEVCGMFTSQWQQTVSSERLYSEFIAMLHQMGYADTRDGAQTRIYLPDAARDSGRGGCRNYPEYVHKELKAARDLAWRSFFQKDSSAVEGILAPELVAIQESSDRWDDRGSLISMAKSMSQRGVQLARLEFPRTEIRLYGDTAILYYTYVMEQRLGNQAVVDAGRGTEVFVWREDRWVDAGWHLDNGPQQGR